MATMAELFEEAFVADEYIERLVWRTPGGGSRGGPEAFDPKRLLEEFQQCQKEAKEFAKKVQELQKSNQIKEAADIIQKLHLIAQELPFDRFSEVKSKIAKCQLIQEFTTAQRRGEISRMREVAAVLLHFKGYSLCVDVYTKQCKVGAYLRNDIFEDAAILCQRVNKRVGDIFSNPEIVPAKLIQNLIKSIFISYLENYVEVETRYLKSRSAMILQCYYDSKNHQKRSIGTGGIQDLKERIRQHTNLPLGPTFERCHRLSDPSDLPGNHIDYALETGLAGIPSSDSRNANLYFLDVVQQANTIFHLFDKQFNDHLMPLISSSPKLSECLQKKKGIIEQMEMKLDTGIDRTLNCMIGQMKHILAAEQKKTDFKPEDENNVLIQYTNACVKVCAYVRKQVEKIKNSMDGKNVDTVLMELGVRFHRLIYEHLQQYSYSYMGGMLAICDVAEYRKCAKDFKIPMVLHLFDTLHALCNLLVVAPDDLKQVCSGEQLANLDKNILHSFVQLCADYRSARLARHFN
uniref:Exocyst complex component Sec10-like alpha-helical bundle domain-containing protein n=1 Tax=Pan paniscus TaxID=9597 RepID=A0A2R9BNY6_PANPA